MTCLFIILGFICLMALLSFLSFYFIFFIISNYINFSQILDLMKSEKIITIDNNQNKHVFIFEIYWPYSVMCHNSSINFIQWKHWEQDYFQTLASFTRRNRLIIDTNNRPHFSSSHLTKVAWIVEVKHFPKVRISKQLWCSFNKNLNKCNLFFLSRFTVLLHLCTSFPILSTKLLPFPKISHFHLNKQEEIFSTNTTHVFLC